MNDLPVTEQIQPRPVYARFLRRMAWEDLDPPSEEEMRDAIQILKDPWEDYLSFEAFGILDEAGS